MLMTYREPRRGLAHWIHALRPMVDGYRTWCDQPGPETPVEVITSKADRPCPNCLEALQAEVTRNERALSHS